MARKTKSRPPAQQLHSDELQIAYGFFNEIGIIAQLSANQMQRVLPDGLTQSQFAVLNWFVRVDTQATPGRLANAFQITKGAMTNTLHKLAAKGFIAVAADPASGRQKIVRMTSSGRRARDAAIAANQPLLKAFLETFELNRIERALPLLKQIRQYLDELRN